MCGIIAVLRRKSRRSSPAAAVVEQAVAHAVRTLHAGFTASHIDDAASALRALDDQLRGVPGLMCLLANPATTASAKSQLSALHEQIAAFERSLDQSSNDAVDEQIELRNAALVRLKDALWSVWQDRIPHAEAVRELAGGGAIGLSAATAWSSIQTALRALDRLEVRGRDSAGISVMLSGLDLSSQRVRDLAKARANDPLFMHGSVRIHDGVIDLAYKHAAEIGELGDNVRALRTALQRDELLHALLADERAEALVLGHTRWASVGVISQPNTHPLNSEETTARGAPYCIGVLNGDVDNHHQLIQEHGLAIADEITTDAKVIPTLVARCMQSGAPFAEAFRRTVASFEGSVATAAATAREPHRIALSLRGSGQALYIGLAEDAFVVASEPYGVIEECARYVRMDGETPGNPANPNGSRGQSVVLDRAHAGLLEGIGRVAFDGTPLPLADKNVTVAAVTTRDIDRAGFPHFLLKEIQQAPTSMQKTLRGRIVREGNRMRAVLPTSSLPDSTRTALQKGRFSRILVIGQGTAAVAGQAVAAALSQTLANTRIDVRALPATELSGFSLRDDMRDTLIIAISQSGTTTDTNRTVDLARQRGAVVLAIVNRRGSDLCDKADGVVFTSDGRDIEMSVASTKAFYAQCAAGWVLALAIARAAGVADDAREDELLRGLLALPDAMREVLAQDAAIEALAKAYAPQRRHWALVGNGHNKIAAAEVRIKLSELCYKSIACDATEDKKHIDLSSEPLIFVCAAGLVGSTADDVAKEVAIYRAHKAAPIVVASEGETRFNGALHLVTVPVVDPALAFILSAMVGHLFGYEAALAIDALARPLREAREAIEDAIASGVTGDQMLRRVSRQIVPMAQRFFDTLRTGSYDGNLEASTAVRLSGLLRDSLSPQPLEAYQEDSGKVGSPSGLIDDLTAALTRAIEELTRPVDAIKHQAKTVTVGISRSDEAVLDRSLVREVLATGAGRDRLAYRTLKVLGDLDGAVAAVTGFTRYQVEGDPSADATITVVDRGGVSLSMPSRVERNSSLRGTKRRVAAEREVLVARGRSDGRHVILVPEVKGSQTTGITLLHVRFHEHLPVATIRTVLQGYDRRYDRLVDWVTETEGSFRDDLLIDVPVVDLLVAPISEVADRWRSQA